MSKNRKAIKLISYCENRDLLPNLTAALAKERPEPWREMFGAMPPVGASVAGLRPAKPPDTRDPRQIFLSHAKEDAEFAHRLRDDLLAEGWRVWIAPESIRPGEKWVEAINRGLETSGVFVVALTPAAVASRWVGFETGAAIDMALADEIRLVTLDVVACKPPVLWRQLQSISFHPGYETGLDGLLGWLDGEPVETGRRPVSTPPRVEAREREPEPPPVPDCRVHAKTGIELIRIPAGPFLYGSTDGDKMAQDNEKPQRTIDLPEYWIGRTPVTNAQFARFVKATGYKTTAEEKGQGAAWTGSQWEWVKGADWRHPRGPESSIDGKDDHPVVQVSWDDAQAFCEWAGLILPSEQQWEKAARGADGRRWPWGNEPPTDRHCNFNRNVKATTPVGRYSPLGDSPYGCVDMAGNVWEWTASWFTEGSTRALRGGSWGNLDQNTRVAYRGYDNPVNRVSYIGFRVAELLSDPGF